MIPRGIAYAEPSIGRVCVARTYRRRGICREMVSRAIGYMVREWRAEAIRISAQSYLIPFYESFGFEVVSDEYLEAGIPHKKMLIRLDRNMGEKREACGEKPSHLLFASLVTTKRLRACATGNNTIIF